MTIVIPPGARAFYGGSVIALPALRTNPAYSLDYYLEAVRHCAELGRKGPARVSAGSSPAAPR